MSENKEKAGSIGVRIVKSAGMEETPSVFYDCGKTVVKSDRSEQLTPENAVNAAEWISHPVDMRGLKTLVDNSTILPQCIRSYRNNIAGFGMSVHYITDYKEETGEMKSEWDFAEKTVSLLNMDCMTKELFENVIRDRETYGIAYCEVIRDMEGSVVQLEFIIDTPSIDMTYPLEPYVDMTYYYRGEDIRRKKKFRKFRQNIAGKTVYFKEFGDPRVMDKRTGAYAGTQGGQVDIDSQANEIIEFRLGSMPYGEVRWIGQVLTIDGSRRAEVLNNAYFRKGRHTPMMIMIKGGTLTEEAFEKLNTYMSGIEGEAGQHAFLVLETDTTQTSAGFQEQKQPEIEIKDMASILQKDELFQEYQENGRKKVQSAFLLPDLYVGYTTDFNRATAQTAMEVTEKQVFQPERASLAWIINNRLLNGYRFRYVEVKFDEPDITNTDDIQKVLNITERAGGLTPNLAKEYTYKVLGRDGCEDYPAEWGDIPLAYYSKLSADETKQGMVTDYEMEQLDGQIKKAEKDDSSLVPILLEIRKALGDYRTKAGE